jgi:hypothetical protein
MLRGQESQIKIGRRGGTPRGRGHAATLGRFIDSHAWQGIKCARGGGRVNHHCERGGGKSDVLSRE